VGEAEAEVELAIDLQKALAGQAGRLVHRAQVRTAPVLAPVLVHDLTDALRVVAELEGRDILRHGSQPPCGFDDRLRQAVERAAQLLGSGSDQDEDDLVDADVAIAFHEIEVGGSAVGADAPLEVAPATAARRQEPVELLEQPGERRWLDVERVPSLAQIGDPAERGGTLAPEMDRRMRLLDGLRVLAAGGEIVELA